MTLGAVHTSCSYFFQNRDGVSDWRGEVVEAISSVYWSFQYLLHFCIEILIILDQQINHYELTPFLHGMASRHNPHHDNASSSVFL